jgi:cell division protein FtsL
MEEEKIRYNNARGIMQDIAQKSTNNSTHESAGDKSQKSSQQSAPKSTQKKTGKGWMKGLISGTFITERLILNNMKYAALVVFLGIILITNKFQAERTNREIVVLEQEVRDLRAESLSVSAELGGVSRQSEIIDLIKERGLGLEELREPPYRIVVNE